MPRYAAPRILHGLSDPRVGRNATPAGYAHLRTDTWYTPVVQCKLTGGSVITDRHHTSRERFLARQWRLLGKADFRHGESDALGEPGTDNSLKSYLRSGPTARFFSRLWNLVITAAGLAGLVGVVVTLTGNVSLGWWGKLLACAFFILLFYFGLYHLAGWRSMRRHRHAPRRGR